MFGVSQRAIQAKVDRRAKLRFPLKADVEYILRPNAKRAMIGRGVTVNLSASGALIDAREQLPVGPPIQASIVWPVRLEGRIVLKLVTHGHTVRVEGNYVAVHFSRHDFRTGSLKTSELPSICPPR